MSTPNFKDGQPLPTSDANVNVIGGMDDSGNVQVMLTDTNGAQKVSTTDANGNTLSVVPASDATSLNGIPAQLIGYYRPGSVTATGGTTTTITVANTVRPGDALLAYSGTAANVGTWAYATSATTASVITLSNALPAAAANGDVFMWLRPNPIAVANPTTTGSGTASLEVNIDSNYQTAASTGILKLEDAASASGDAGVNIFGVRQDNLTTTTNLDGDYTALSMNRSGAAIVELNSLNSASSKVGRAQKLDTEAWATGDYIIATSGTVNEGVSSRQTTAGRYVPIAVDRYGAVMINIDPRTSNSGISPARRQGASQAALVTGDGFMLSGFYREAALSTSGAAGTDAQGSWAKVDDLGALWVRQAGNSYSHITTATTTVVKSGAGILGKIVINKAVASGVITIYDNTAASGTVVGIITFPATLLRSQDELTYDVAVGTGITIVTSAATDLTVTFK